MLASIFISNFIQMLYQAMIYNEYIVLVHFKQYQEKNKNSAM